MAKDVMVGAHSCIIDQKDKDARLEAGEVTIFPNCLGFRPVTPERVIDRSHLFNGGGRIFAEVLLGLLDADPGSYRSADPGWCPALPSAEQNRFSMADMLLFATETAP